MPRKPNKPYFPTLSEIEALIQKSNKKLSLDKIAKALNLHDGQEIQKLTRKLATLVEEEKITETQDGFSTNAIAAPAIGTVLWEKGDLVVRPQMGGTKVLVRHVPEEQLLPGDVVRYEITRQQDHLTIGHIIEVIERVSPKVVGLFRSSHRHNWMRPLYRPYDKWDVRITKMPDNLEVEEGDMIVVRLGRKKTHMGDLIGECIDVLGDPDAPGADITGAMHQFDLPHEFTKATQKQCEKFTSEVPKASYNNREDLRQTPFVTIDGEDAKDYDDAVWCTEMPKGGWRLKVAIADVGHYVEPGSPLDQDAIQRGTSVYFPGHVVPMLPETLSNDLCSLKPNIDRLAMICDMTISDKGKITKSMFYEGVICSHARLTYHQVQDYLDGHPETRKELDPLGNELHALHDLFKALLKARTKRGAIEFESSEPIIMFDSAGHVASIEKRERVTAHRIIEECMLSANVCAAAVLQENKMPVPYRVHVSPPDEKVSDLKQSLALLGITFPGPGIKKLMPKHYTELLHTVADREDASFIQSLVLRSMSQAVYSTENEGHFGLAYKAYVHFTSPIRRYPDLVVHRALKVLLLGRSSEVEKWQANADALAKLSMHSSMAERRADEASRDAVKALKCRYVLDHVGEEHPATVIGVTHFGLFLELDTLHVDGLIHIAELGDEYFTHDAIRHQLIGEASNATYTLGDKLLVRIEQVSIESRKVDFRLLRAISVKVAPKKRKSNTRRRPRQRSK